MTNPWGLSGPQFLGLYVGAAAVSFVLVLVLRSLLRGSGPADPGPVDVYTAAAVAGGSDRVVDTAVYALVEGDHLRTARDRTLTVCGGRPDEPVQQAVLDSFGTRDSATLSEVRGWAGKTRQVQEAVLDAVDRKLLVSARRRVLARLTGLLPLAVLVVGIMRAVNGARLDRPISSLVVLMALTVPLVLIPMSGPPEQSRAGLRMSRAARRAPSGSGLVGAAYTSTGALVPTAVIAVAALGAGGVQDQDLRSALFGSVAATAGGGAGATSSCGGSSCGGGGCGGGGGGGGCGG
ncbi:TIGR04222 domain-containing membrane protein [Streptacidiphilus sp. PAMC 29251]